MTQPDTPDNPFFADWTTPDGVPPFDRIKPEHFRPAYARAFAAHYAEIAAIAALGFPLFTKPANAGSSVGVRKVTRAQDLADAVRAGLPVPVVTVTDTPLARETDYGRVDDHSSAIRADGDTRHTFNRVPDYPSPGAETVYGAWAGGRLSASSSSSDATALPEVATAASPAAAWNRSRYCRGVSP